MLLLSVASAAYRPAVSLGGAAFLVRHAPPAALLQRESSVPDGSLAVIAVPRERLLVPGQMRTMHLYDTSCIEAFQSGLATGGFGVVALEPRSASDRSFKLEPVGT